jgi:hypothetical protein
MPCLPQNLQAGAVPQLVPPHGNHAFDLIVEVGLACFLRHQQNQEIQKELDGRWGLRLDCSTISELAAKELDRSAEPRRPTAQASKAP